MFTLLVCGLPVGSMRTTSAAQSGSAGANNFIREEQTIAINGSVEVWRLQWKTPPTPVCAAEDGSFSLTCPCDGFAYGESGDLDLVRLRQGQEIERLPLGQFFSKDYNHKVWLQRWQPTAADGDHSQTVE